MQALLPEKRMLYQPNLAKAAGSNLLAERIRQLKPIAHVFGHTHFNWDCSIDGVRYLQRPLAYPKERRSACCNNVQALPDALRTIDQTKHVCTYSHPGCRQHSCLQ